MIKLVFMQNSLSASTIKRIIGLKQSDFEIHIVSNFKNPRQKSLMEYINDISQKQCSRVATFKILRKTINSLDSDETIFCHFNHDYMDNEGFSHFKKIKGKFIQFFNEFYGLQFRSDENLDLRKRDEKLYEMCDGFIVPNPLVIDLIHKYCGYKKPSFCYYLYTCPELFQSPSHPPKNFSIAYGGSTSTQRYRDYRSTFEKITNQRIFVDHYGKVRYDSLNSYYRYHGWVSHLELLKNYSKSTAGLFSYGEYYLEDGRLSCQYGIGNKIFDYLAGGIPIVCIRDYDYASEFVRRNELGIVVDRHCKISKYKDKLDEIRKTIPEKRNFFVTQSQKNEISEFFKEILNGSDNT